MKLLYLSALSFVFIVSVGLTLVRDREYIFIRRETKANSLPILKNEPSFPIISAQGVTAVDLGSGVTLYEKNPDLPLLPASTTKIMTALVAMDYYTKDMVLEAGNIKVDGQKMGLVPGEKIRFDSLLTGLLVYSANDAAELIAENYPGGRESFINAMNLKASELYLNNTKFVNPTGLDGSYHYSTARDMVRLAEVAMRNTYFSEIVGTKQITVTSVDGKILHKMRNINELLGEVPGVTGVKTGWTEDARENLVTSVERDGKRILIAVLGSQDRFGETKELIDWIFKNYSWQTVSYSP